MEKARARTFPLSVEPPVLWSVFLEAWRKVASTPGDIVDVLITTAGVGVLTGVLGSRWSQPYNSAPLVDCASTSNAGMFDRRINARATFRPLPFSSVQTANSSTSAELQLGKRMHDLHKMFAHRENSPDSFDSICLRCYRTVGTREHESDLSADEENHVCKGFWPHSSRISNSGTRK